MTTGKLERTKRRELRRDREQEEREESRYMKEHPDFIPTWMCWECGQKRPKTEFGRRADGGHYSKCNACLTKKKFYPEPKDSNEQTE